MSPARLSEATRQTIETTLTLLGSLPTTQARILVTLLLGLGTAVRYWASAPGGWAPLTQETEQAGQARRLWAQRWTARRIADHRLDDRYETLCDRVTEGNERTDKAIADVWTAVNWLRERAHGSSQGAA